MAIFLVGPGESCDCIFIRIQENNIVLLLHIISIKYTGLAIYFFFVWNKSQISICLSIGHVTNVFSWDWSIFYHMIKKWAKQTNLSTQAQIVKQETSRPQFLYWLCLSWKNAYSHVEEVILFGKWPSASQISLLRLQVHKSTPTLRGSITQTTWNSNLLDPWVSKAFEVNEKI